ncbi:SpoIIE family protein phosphatase [Streptomyces odonnellii]|uniref:SpoIIE family protein phosphatase n=1 Tax=Streptomyces odonnellii TaxID=1417980 RepID=UPI0006261719|nr:SpoIIE family protein phosphatase [Streptomyces odonnellii]
MEEQHTPGIEWPHFSDDGTDTARAAVDEHGVVILWNEGARKLLGYPSAEVLGSSAASLLDEEVPAETLPTLQGLVRWHGSLPLRHQDGHRIVMKVLAHRYIEGGRSLGWLLVCPLTRTGVEPEDHALMVQSYEQSPCSMAVFDTDLRLRRANGSAERTMNLTEADLRGLRSADFLPFDSEVDKVRQAMTRVRDTGKPQYLENYIRVPGETRKHAWSNYMYPLQDENGCVRGVAITAHDITAQHWAHKRLQMLNAAGAHIGSTLDVAQTAQELADVAIPEFADFVSVDLLESVVRGEEPTPGSISGSIAFRRIAMKSVLDGCPESTRRPGEAGFHPEYSLAARAVIAGEVVQRSSIDPEFAPWLPEFLGSARSVDEFSIHSVLAAPLRARGTVLGVAVFARHRNPGVFDEDDLLLAEELTGRAAVCVDNARRYTRERDTAVTLQRSLLPQRTPSQAAVEVAFRYLPSDVLAGMGGDWFDVILLSSARVALVVGDVMGHGIHASASMGRLRTAVRTLADVDLPPDELLTHLDDLVVRLSTEASPDDASQYDPAAEAAGGFGATCLYVVYDPVSRVCTLARAGHPGPALVKPDGTVEFLDVPAGPPLGLGGLPFEATQLTLPEGSLLALYTDGLIESRDRDIDMGIDQLRNALAQPATSLDNVCDTILGALPGQHFDDIALVVARTHALGAQHVATLDVPPDPAAVADARAFAAERLAAWDLEETAFVTELVVSELVTNAIRYADPPIQLRLIRDRNLICEVTDASTTAPHLRRARVYDEGGRGLLLVAQLTSSWGTRYSATGKTIWAEQVLPQPSLP